MILKGRSLASLSANKQPAAVGNRLREREAGRASGPGVRRSAEHAVIKGALHGKALRQNPAHHIPRNPRQPRVQPLELHRQSFVVDAQHVQHSRMEIGHGHGVLDRGVT